MKTYLVLAVFLAVIAAGLLIATLFVDGGGLIMTSIGAGLALAAFIIVFVAYANKSVK